MVKCIDYRITKYCPQFININKKKKDVETLVKNAHPKAQDMHSYISDNSGMFKRKFLQAYNGKCAYCGISTDLIQKNEFEIDHFLYKKAPQFVTRKDAGYIENLVLACRNCNQNKSSFLIVEEYFDKLNPDGEEIKHIFIRDEKYYICINEEYKNEQYIKKYYDKLRLGSELHRLDYLLMNIIGLQRKCQKNEVIYTELGKILDIIRAKRNII